MSDDREYWRRQDDRREERRREHQRDDFRRDEQRRLDWEREDREVEIRQREEDHRRAMEAMRQGNTAWALSSIVGPDAAINYLRAMQAPSDDVVETTDEHDAEPAWPPHVFVTSVEQLVANVASAPAGCALHAVRIDRDGDALVEARWQPSSSVLDFATRSGLLSQSALEVGHFWVRRQVVDEIAIVASALRGAADLAGAIDALPTER